MLLLNVGGGFISSRIWTVTNCHLKACRIEDSKPKSVPEPERRIPERSNAGKDRSIADVLKDFSKTLEIDAVANNFGVGVGVGGLHPAFKSDFIIAYATVPGQSISFKGLYLLICALSRAVIVAQLIEQLLPTPEIPSSNPVIGNF